MPTNSLTTGRRHRLYRAPRQTLVRRNTRIFKMLCSRCVLPLLALYMLLEQISAAVMPRRPKREVDWLDHEVFSRPSDEFETGELSVGDAGDTRRGVGDGSESAIVPTPRISAQSQNQDLHNRKASEKRRKVAPLDPISRFQIPNSRNRKEKKHIYGEN